MATDRNTTAADLSLSDEAIAWVVRLNSGKATDTERQAFARWRVQSADHESAAQEAEAVWSGIGTVGGEQRKAERKASRKKMTRRSVLGGGVLLIAGAGLYRSGMIGGHLFADYVTAVAETRTVTLPDGTQVELNGDSALSVEYSDALRKVALHRGQAIFSVAANPARPFVVEAGGGTARVLGTVFDVDLRPDDTVVTVVEGKVAVASSGAAGAVDVGGNQRVSYVAGRAPAAPQDVDAAAATAWRRGKLIFNDRALGDVIAEVERHRSGRIMLMGDSLRRLPVTGVFENLRSRFHSAHDRRDAAGEGDASAVGDDHPLTALVFQDGSAFAGNCAAGVRPIGVVKFATPAV
ncbi:FecR domain-containing protein [Hyphomicrobium sp. D-2]|uniref:FecR family protein n=1 Tax=Hyphomicrobium sp. D-2 TaxID=3041621 RepID=UPI0024569F7D|nr:FecR domain-containing protein [Hyphomicrobium sp. D-2]MDH4982605.1 FecR domain-containing protein [Hyphomicrobium sp. D-2]